MTATPRTMEPAVALPTKEDQKHFLESHVAGLEKQDGKDYTSGIRQLAEAKEARAQEQAPPSPEQAARLADAPVEKTIGGRVYRTRCPRMRTIRRLLGPVLSYLQSNKGDVAQLLSGVEATQGGNAASLDMDRGLGLLTQAAGALAGSGEEGQAALGCLLDDVFRLDDEQLGAHADHSRGTRERDLAAFGWWDALSFADATTALEVAIAAVPFGQCWRSLAGALNLRVSKKSASG